MILRPNPEKIRDPEQGFRYRYVYGKAIELIEAFYYRQDPTRADMDSFLAGLWAMLLRRFPEWADDELARAAVEDVANSRQPRW